MSQRLPFWFPNQKKVYPPNMTSHPCDPKISLGNGAHQKFMSIKAIVGRFRWEFTPWPLVVGGLGEFPAKFPGVFDFRGLISCESLIFPRLLLYGVLEVLQEWQSANFRFTLWKSQRLKPVQTTKGLPDVIWAESLLQASHYTGLNPSKAAGAASRSTYRDQNPMRFWPYVSREV